jgi:hypothetical protein
MTLVVALDIRSFIQPLPKSHESVDGPLIPAPFPIETLSDNTEDTAGIGRLHRIVHGAWHAVRLRSGPYILGSTKCG